MMLKLSEKKVGPINVSYSATKYEIMFVDITAKPIEVMKAGKRFNL